MTHEENDRRDAEPRKRARADAPKERVLHTRVPAVLEQELKRLAKNLRVPVSNVVRAILEDAVDAVDTVGEVAEDELMGFVDRLSKQRDHLRERVTRRPDEAAPPAEESEAPGCPESADVLEGAFGFQPLVLATEVDCSVCGERLAAGSDACRALFDDPGKRVFLSAQCRLLPDRKRRT